MSRPDDSLDDRPARTAKLICKLQQVQSSLTDPQAVELNKSRFVDFKRNTGPKGVDIVGLLSRTHCNRHNRVGA